MHLADLVWTTVAIVFTVVYFMLLFRTVLDVFRNDELSRWGKAGWYCLLLAVPLVPLVVYVITRADGMAERDVPDGPEVTRRAGAPAYGAAADQIARAHDLLASGAITAQEFDMLKSRALSD